MSDDNKIKKDFKTAKFIYLTLYIGLIFALFSIFFQILNDGAGTKS